MPVLGCLTRDFQRRDGGAGPVASAAYLVGELAVLLAQPCGLGFGCSADLLRVWPVAMQRFVGGDRLFDLGDAAAGRVDGGIDLAAVVGEACGKVGGCGMVVHGWVRR